MSQVPSGLAHYTRLNSAVWINRPSAVQTSDQPHLIVLVGWMNAASKHIAKYTAGYEELYPSSQILAITTSSVDAVVRSKAANLNRIKPVVDILCTIPPGATILLHSFSNGGAFTTVTIAAAYRERMGKALPITATVLDSSPGRARYQATIRAFAVALPKNVFALIIGGIFLRILFPLYVLGYRLMGKPDLVDQTRFALNDKNLFKVDAPRLYIYGIGDDMVDWQDVEEHGTEAHQLGYTIIQEKFLDSEHAAHMIIDRKRYWNSVQRLWSSTCTVA